MGHEELRRMNVPSYRPVTWAASMGPPMGSMSPPRNFDRSVGNMPPVTMPPMSMNQSMGPPVGGPFMSSMGPPPSSMGPPMGSMNMGRSIGVPSSMVVP